jgi:hypothetical protein
MTNDEPLYIDTNGYFIAKGNYERRNIPEDNIVVLSNEKRMIVYNNSKKQVIWDK